MRRTKTHLRQIIAVLLSIALVFSASGGMTVTGYAAENAAVEDKDGGMKKKSDASMPDVESDLQEHSLTEQENASEQAETKKTETEENETEKTGTEEIETEKTETEAAGTEGTEIERTETKETETEEAETEAESEEELLIEDETTPDNAAYTGTVEEYESWRELCIREEEFESAYCNSDADSDIDSDAAESGGCKVFDDAAVIEILSVRAADEERFDAVTLEYKAIAGHDTISKELWNALADFGGKKEDSFSVSLCYCGEEEPDHNWGFFNPSPTEEESVNIGLSKLEIQDSEGGGVRIAFANTAFPAEMVQFVAYTDTSRTNAEMYQALKRAFGGMDDGRMELQLFDSEGTDETVDAGGAYWSGSKDSGQTIQAAFFSLEDINKLQADKEYILNKRIYKGDIWTDEENGRTGLDVSYRGAGKETALDENEIGEILSYHEGESFDEIYLEQPESDSNVIAKAMAEKLYQYLKTDSDDRRIRFGFVGEKESCTEWKLWEPEPEQISDQTVMASLDVADGVIRVTIDRKPEFNARHTELAISRNRDQDAELAESIIQILGEDGKEIVFRDDEGNEIGGYYSSDEWNVRFDTETDGFAEGTEYTVEEWIYKGDTWSWRDDGNEGEERFGFGISYRGAGKEEGLTADEIRQILSYHSGEVFDEIHLEQPISDNNVILKEIADALCRYLKPGEDGEDHRLKFFFTDAQTESWVEWRLVNPDEAQAGDLSVSAVMTISDGQVCLNVSGASFQAERVELAFEKDMTTDADSASLVQALGDTDCEIVFRADGEQDVYGYYSIDRENNILGIEVHDVSELRPDTIYHIEKSRYLGEESEQYMLLSSFNSFYDQERFTKEQFEEIVTFYERQGRTFDTVVIQQKYTDDNTIDQELYNAAIRILSDTEDRQLLFCFCRCQDTEETELWNDFVWSFTNPAAVDKNINGNMTLEIYPNKGIVVQLPDNPSYSADNVEISYDCNLRTDIGKAFEAALGKPENDLFIMDMTDQVIGTPGGACYLANDMWENGPNYILSFNQVSDWKTDRKYWLARVESIQEWVSGECELPALPEGAQNPVWQSYNKDIADIDAENGTLRQIDGNEGDVYFSVTYILDGEEYSKVYMVHMAGYVIRIERIQFDRQSLTMELPRPEDDWEALDYLAVKYYPANATMDMDPSSLKWTSSDSTVVIPKRDGNGRYSGEIKAVGAGTATIKAAYNDKIFAECVVIVEAPVVIGDGKWPEPYAVTNVDRTLGDVVLPKDDSGEWKWKEPDTSLTPYTSMEWHDFAAVYTRKSDGKTMDAMIGVRMISVDGIEIIPDDSILALTAGQTIRLDWNVIVGNGDYHADIEANTKYGSRFDIRWSTKPTGILQETVDADGRKYQNFTADTTTGKKTVTVSVVNQQTNKVIAKDSATIYVTKKPVMNYEEMKVIVDGEPQNPGDWIWLDKEYKPTGTIVFTTDNEANRDYTLRVKSSDTSVIDVKSSGVNRVTYTLKNYGKAQLTITADDEIKSSWKIDVSVPDQEPQIVQPQVTINKVCVDKKARLTIVYADGFRADGTDAVTVEGDSFEYKDGYLILKNTDLKGTVSAKIRIKYVSDDGSNRFVAERVVKVKLTQTVPKVTFKQTKKVNTFYQNSSESHYGLLTVTAGNSQVSGVQFDQSADFELEASGKKDTYRIRLKDGKTSSGQLTTVSYVVTDNTGTMFEVRKELRVASENKAPTLVPSAKTDTLYPKAGFNDSVLTISDKATGKTVEITSVKCNNQTLENTTLALKKNTYDAVLEENTRIRFVLHDVENNSFANGTDKMTLSIENSEWTKPVNVAYSLKVDGSNPKVKLGSSVLTLNKNESVGIYQSMEIRLTLAGRATPFDGNVTFEGPANILNRIIVLEDRGEGRISVRMNVAKEDLKMLSEGKYQFKLRASKDTWQTGAETTLTVHVRDLSEERCIKVSRKGSIDVLRRGQTCIAYQPKVTNLAGHIIGGYIKGRDADLFDAEYDTLTGLCVRAKSNTVDDDGNEVIHNYSTKAVYKVTPVFRMETEDGYQYEVTASGQTLKVTQGKPKLTVLSDYGNVLYRQAGNGELTFGITAVLANENISIRDVALANYKRDLNLVYDAEDQTVTLGQMAMQEITKTGKTWNVRLSVRYADRAGNEKDAVITYKVLIK